MDLLLKKSITVMVTCTSQIMSMMLVYSNDVSESGLANVACDRWRARKQTRKLVYMWLATLAWYWAT